MPHTHTQTSVIHAPPWFITQLLASNTRCAQHAKHTYTQINCVGHSCASLFHNRNSSIRCMFPIKCHSHTKLNWCQYSAIDGPCSDSFIMWTVSKHLLWSKNDALGVDFIIGFFYFNSLFFFCFTNFYFFQEQICSCSLPKKKRASVF